MNSKKLNKHYTLAAQRVGRDDETARHGRSAPGDGKERPHPGGHAMQAVCQTVSVTDRQHARPRVRRQVLVPMTQRQELPMRWRQFGFRSLRDDEGLLSMGRLSRKMLLQSLNNL